MIFKGPQVVFRLTFQADHRKDGDCISHFGRINRRMVGFDDAFVFQRAHAAEAGRGR